MFGIFPPVVVDGGQRANIMNKIPYIEIPFGLAAGDLQRERVRVNLGGWIYGR
jgi:hypothetical protein